MKKYNLSLLFAVATLMLGACQSPVKVEEVVNDGVEAKVEQDSPAEVEESKIKTTTYYDESLFMLPIDHPYWETTTLDKDTIREMKERYGFSDEGMASNNEVIAEEDSKDVSSVEKVNGKLDSEEVKTTNDNETSSTVSTSTSNTNNNATSTSTKPNTSDSTTNNNSSDVTKPNNNPSSSNSSTTNKPTTPPVVEEKPQPSEPAPQPTPPVVEKPSEPAPQPTPPVVEESKKPVDLLDWNYIKSTLIAKGESLGMTYEPSMNRELDGYASPWQSSYMTVTNEDVIGYIGYQMEEASSWGRTYFNIEWVPQGDGNVNIYLIR